ncbi:MAG TPA: Uma2 family endonuclease [Xanthobacteraceae bacterium]|nr:Uma2 family endonuclease [Xanthobacteraceae bacterium]
MTALTKPRMTVDEFLSWAEDNPGRYELFRGEVYAMSPETVGHAERKGAVYLALREAVRRHGLPCHVVPDGGTVRIDDITAYEPDALVYCGQKLLPSAIEISNPVIIVEVLSPSSRQFDVSIKLAGYFRLPSVAHYLIVDPNEPLIVHHARSTGRDIVTRIVTEGTIALDPPGLRFTVDEVYAA